MFAKPFSIFHVLFQNLDEIFENSIYFCRGKRWQRGGGENKKREKIDFFANNLLPNRFWPEFPWPNHDPGT